MGHENPKPDQTGGGCGPRSKCGIYTAPQVPILTGPSKFDSGSNDLSQILCKGYGLESDFSMDRRCNLSLGHHLPRSLVPTSGKLWED